jgi:undecaprenyl-diphosphatase
LRTPTFFSGHASTTGAISATATYLAFMRSGPRHARPWITLGIGTLLTAFVSYERVRAGEHFPTDVIMGSLVGAGIGVLVPHFHRRPHYHERTYCAPPLIIGLGPTSRSSGELTGQLPLLSRPVGLERRGQVAFPCRTSRPRTR